MANKPSSLDWGRSIKTRSNKNSAKWFTHENVAIRDR